MSEKKSADEVYCQTCGEIIKKEAEICPNCGVRNKEYEPQKNNKKPTTQNSSQNKVKSNTSQIKASKTHDPSQYETTVSGSWGYGVGISVALWVLGFIPPEGSAVAGFSFIIAWPLMPISIHYDRQWLQASTRWKPDQKFWLVLSLIPLINLVVGIVYLFRRYNTEKISKPTTQDTFNDSTEDTAIKKLREQYANGELNDEEFEQKVEKIVATEDPEDAKKYVDSE